MTNIYELSLSPDYCSHWGVQEAIRELIQNMLDSEGENDVFYNRDTLSITNKDTSIPTSTLLLGSTTKSNDKESVGQFGEGFKVALLILCRLGYKLNIINGDVTWTPKIEFSQKYQTDLLVIEENPYRSDEEELTFIITGLTKEDLEEVIKRCLYLSDLDSRDYDVTDRGRIFYDEKGKLYVGGLYVKDTDLEYSYDFNPDCLSLNRDRGTVDGWDLGMATLDLLNSLGRADIIKGLLDKDAKDVYYAQYGYHYLSNQLRDEVYNLYSNKKVIASTEGIKKELINKGYSEETIEIETNHAKSAIILNSSLYNNFVDSIPVKTIREESPLELLEKFIEDNYFNIPDETLQELEILYEIFEDKGVKWQE